jgi:hypothetical protein
MADCELLNTCIFFNDKMADMPSTAEVIKIRYCREEYSGCARHMIYKAIGREKVPQDLFPNNTERAKQIIDGK